MKFLLAIAMTTVITSSAFGGECSIATPRECKTAADCTGISKDGKQFEMMKTTTDTVCSEKLPAAIATNCAEGQGGGRTSKPTIVDEKPGTDSTKTSTR